MPSVQTLAKVLNEMRKNARIHYGVLESMSKMGMNNHPLKKFCSRVFDEMTIQPLLDIAIKPGTLDVISLEDLIQVGNGRKKCIADKALVFMLTGINNKWTQPVACFFTESGVKTY